MSPRLSDVFLRTQTDERLAALAEHGHERAFGVLVERYRPRLIRAASGLVGADRAEDVAQQTLLRAWSAVQAGTTVVHVSGWLHQILRNTAYSEHARSRQHGQLTDDMADLHSSSSDVESRLALAAILAEMDKMPEHQRAALIQTEFTGRSRREVAAELGVSEGAVRQLVYRARSTLRAAATAITPFPVAAWAAARPGAGSVLAHRMAELGGQTAAAPNSTAASGGTLLGGGALIKGGAAVLAAGALGGGLAIKTLTSSRPHRHRIPDLLSVQHASGVADFGREFTPLPPLVGPAGSAGRTRARDRGASTTSTTAKVSRPSVSQAGEPGTAISPEDQHTTSGSLLTQSSSGGEYGSSSSSDTGSASTDPTNGSTTTSTNGQSNTPSPDQSTTTPSTPPAADQSTSLPESGPGD